MLPLETLACVGLGVHDLEGLDHLVDRVVPYSASLGRCGDTEVRRWDDASGSRLVVGLQGRAIVDFLPSFAGPISTPLDHVKFITDDVALADVVGETGEVVTRFSVEIEERRLVDRDREAAGEASVVALGVDVSLHRDARLFSESRASPYR